MQQNKLILLVILLFGFSASLALAQSPASQISTPVSSPDTAQSVPESGFPIIVCPSGVGNPICEYRFAEPAEAGIIQDLCAQGDLPSDVCTGLSTDRVPATCPVLTAYSVEYAGRVCDGLERNEFCYGYETVNVSPAGLVQSAGEMSELTPVVSLTADAFNVRTAIYGIASVNAHADLPVEIGSTTGLRMVLFGRMVVENRVPSAEAVVLPDEAVAVTVAESTDLFDAQVLLGTENAIGAVEAGETLMADVVSADGNWVRVMFLAEQAIGESASAWISTDAVEFAAETDFDLLAIADADSFTPLQSFYFSGASSNVAASGPSCQPGTGSTLFLQAPEGVQTDYVANNARITVIGSVAMQLIRNDTQMEITVLSGVAIAYGADGSTGIIIPAGYVSVIDVVPSEGFYRVADNAEWETPRELAVTEMSNIRYYEGLPESLLNQPVNVPECGPDSVGETCDIQYDYTPDATLVTDLCGNGILPEDFSVCQ